MACGAADEPRRLSAELDALGVDLDALFAPPTAEEVAEVRASWAARDLAPRDVVVEAVRDFPEGELRVLSHTVDGHRHVGAVYVPDGPGPFAVANSWIGFGPPFEIDASKFEPGEDPMVVALPSFRGHTMRLGDAAWESDGPRFDQCDGGLDDALAFLNVVLETVDSADPTRVVAVGGSRGGNVALLAGARDERFDVVGSLAGPTSYLVRDWIDHPNLDALYRNWFVAPLLSGTGSVADARFEMLACSPVAFVDTMPPVQIHHGDADPGVPVDTAIAFAEAWEAAGRAPEEFELYVYPGEGHQLAGVVEQVRARIDAFITRHLAE